MREFCHTCRGELAEGNGESPFCPHCGAPQLFLSLDYQSVETGGEAPPVAAGEGSTGTLPPPRLHGVEWKTAIRCALGVSAVGGLMGLGATRLPVLPQLCFLWVVSGSVITLGLYQRSRPAAWMDVRVGARIGVVVGLCLAVCLAVPLAGAGLVARFGLHSMAAFDAAMATIPQKVVQQSTTPIPPDVVQWMGSQEMRAGMMLWLCGLGALFVMALSVLGGAFGGMLRMRRGPASS